MTGILFDFGGTIDTNGVHWSEKFWEWYERAGLPDKYEIVKQTYERSFVQSDEILLRTPSIASMTFRQTLELQLAEQFRILNIADPVLQREILEGGYADVTAIIGRAAALLSQLRQRYKIALVSNFYGNLDVVVNEFGLRSIFDTTVDSAIVGVRKPDPAIFALAMERLGLPASGTFVVGDSYDRDIVPGKKLGCSTIWLKGRSWTTHPTVTPDADMVIGSFEELGRILL